MATWPSTKAATTNLDSGSDKPSLARADIKQNVDNVNAIIDMFDLTGSTDGDILVYDTTSGTFQLEAPPVTIVGNDLKMIPASTGKSVVNNINYYESPYTLTYASTITPDVANGNVQIVTLTGAVTFSAFSNSIAGQSLTLIVKQDGTGSRALTSTMKFAGGTKTLSTAANSVDIITVFYDGTNYWASLGKDFK
jgi:hypothetical protein